MAVNRKKRNTVGIKIKAKPELSRRKLDELAQEMVASIQTKAQRADLAGLKKDLGKDIGKIKLNSLHGQISGHIGNIAGGYESKLWEKVCC